MDWWWEEYGSRLRSSTIRLFIEKHLRKGLGSLPLPEVTAAERLRGAAEQRTLLPPGGIDAEPPINPGGASAGKI